MGYQDETLNINAAELLIQHNQITAAGNDEVDFSPSSGSGRG